MNDNKKQAHGVYGVIGGDTLNSPNQPSSYRGGAITLIKRGPYGLLMEDCTSLLMWSEMLLL